MNVPIDAGLPHFDRFVDNLRMVGATSGVAFVTTEIQRKIEDIIRPRIGVNIARVAVDMMSTDMGTVNETQESYKCYTRKGKWIPIAKTQSLDTR